MKENIQNFSCDKTSEEYKLGRLLSEYSSKELSKIVRYMWGGGLLEEEKIDSKKILNMSI